MSRKNAQKHWKVTKYEVTRIRLMVGGLIAISLIIVQDFISSGVFTSSKTLDIFSFISVISFAVALPLLTAHILITSEDASRHYALDEPLGLRIAYWLGVIGALTGIVAAFLHISLIAGLVILISILIGATLFAEYVAKLRRLDKVLKQNGIKNLKEDVDPHYLELK